jgi:hypothetical protein
VIGDLASAARTAVSVQDGTVDPRNWQAAMKGQLPKLRPFPA